MALEAGKITKCNAAQKTAIVGALDRDGFSPLRSGLGVPAGEYQFTSANGEIIFAVKPIVSGKGQKFGLTLVAGTLKGASDNNKHISNAYGLEPSDKQMVVTLDQFMAIEPNQTYKVTVGENGRISAMVAAIAEVGTLSVASAPAVQTEF